MAKKSTAKKSKNTMQIVWDLLTIVLGGLLLGFMALPHQKLLVFGEEASSATGYQLITFEEGTNTGIAIVLLLITIFAALMVLGGFMKVLADASLVKSKLFAKVAKFVMLISALATLVLLIVSMILIASASDGAPDKLTNKVSGWVAVWMTLIVNACLGGVAFVSSLLSLKK